MGHHTYTVNSHTKHTGLKLVYANAGNTFLHLQPQAGCRTFSTHRLTVPSGSRLASGGSNRSSLLQLTLLPTAWTPCALDRSSLQLQALKEASKAGQGWESFDSVAHNSKSSVSARRSDSKQMPNPGAFIVLRLNFTSAASPPPVIPYLYRGAPSGALSRARRAEMIAQ